MCDKHPPFSLQAGDRAKEDFHDALSLAAERARRRGVQQRVRRHVGEFLTAWFVQDQRDVTA